MSLVRFGIAVILVSSICCANGQFMDGFFQNMNNMMNNMQRMSQNMAYMNSEQMARARAAGENLRPGQRRFFDDGNTRGSAYRSPNGGYSYSFSSGGPGSSGYEYSSGPDGTYHRRW